MDQHIRLRCICIAFFAFSFGYTQVKKAGPLIKEHGKVWKVENPDFKTDTSKEFKVVFDIMNSPEGHETVNTSIETAARFLNMHAQSGVPAEQMNVVLVVHNKASKDIMTDQAYLARYKTKNLNTHLIESLMDNGVQIVFCGQSSASRDIPASSTAEGVQMALSAMTALIQLQDEGFQLIKF